MKQTRQFGYLAENRLVVWRKIIWLFSGVLFGYLARFRAPIVMLSNLAFVKFIWNPLSLIIKQLAPKMDQVSPSFDASDGYKIFGCYS